MKILGYIQSPRDDRDIVFSHKIETLWESYNVNSLSYIRDQGNDPVCAAICIADILAWQEKVAGGKGSPNIFSIFDLREDKSQQGLIPRDTLKQIKKQGVDGFTIDSYARISDPESAKAAILMNGPVMIGTEVYNYDNTFWKGGGKLLGGHAVLLTGWNKKGFVVRNSWGTSWGGGGYTHLPFGDWIYVLEAWTILLKSSVVAR